MFLFFCHGVARTLMVTNHLFICEHCEKEFRIGAGKGPKSIRSNCERSQVVTIIRDGLPNRSTADMIETIQ